MPSSSRFPVAIHVLALLARSEDCSTSEAIAESVCTNPVVIRRLLSQLREAGIVGARCGPGGGTTLARPAEEITLRDVREAIGESTLWATPPDPNPKCEVARNMLEVMSALTAEANTALDEVLSHRTVADINSEIVARQKSRTTRTS